MNEQRDGKPNTLCEITPEVESASDEDWVTACPRCVLSPCSKAELNILSDFIIRAHGFFRLDRVAITEAKTETLPETNKSLKSHKPRRANAGTSQALHLLSWLLLLSL